jgi:hypothetical protein
VPDAKIRDAEEGNGESGERTVVGGLDEEEMVPAKCVEV